MLLLAVVLAALPGVATPSGNIHCFYVPAKPAHLLCDVHQASYNVREQDGCMARAGLDWHGWELAVATRAQPVCSGGVLYNSNRDKPVFKTLAYGTTWHFAAFSCRSRVTGLTCTTSKGHGIFISRQSWRGW